MNKYIVYFDACIGSNGYKTKTTVSANSSINAEKIVLEYSRCIKISAVEMAEINSQNPGLLEASK